MVAGVANGHPVAVNGKVPSEQNGSVVAELDVRLVLFFPGLQL